MYTYVVYGIQLKSEIELPELSGTESMTPFDSDPVEIHIGEVPHDLIDAETSMEGYRVLKDRVLLVMAGTARFLITGGKFITIALVKGHEPSWLRIVLLSGALGILLHQRGILPLHASAVVSEDVCIAFGGHSGVGKSTLAAGLSRHGLKLLTEDKLIVRPTNSGWRAWPGVPFLHLSAESAEQGGLATQSRTSTSPRTGKYIYLNQMRFDLTSRLLKVFYLISWSPTGSEPKITNLSPTEAFFGLRASTSLPGLIPIMGRELLYLECLGDLLKNIAVFTFSRPPNYEQFGAGLELLRSHWRSLIAERPLSKE